MADVFFGFGHGFGGTHLLAKLLDLCPNVDCGHERKAKCSPHALFDKFLPVYRGEGSASEVILAERVPMISQTLNTGQKFGEINGALTFFVKALYEHFPDAKFIHMVRDPRKQIISTHNTGIYDYSVYEKEKMWWWPYPREGDPYYEKWEGLSILEKCAWDWYLYNNTILEELEHIPKERVFFYKFEDMIRGNKLSELFSFLELFRPEQRSIEHLLSIKHSKTPVTSPSPVFWNMLPRSRKAKVAAIVSDVSKKIGYGDLND